MQLYAAGRDSLEYSEKCDPLTQMVPVKAVIRGSNLQFECLIPIKILLAMEV